MAKIKNHIELQFLSEPSDVNYGGKVHGGMMMKWIDQAAFACAYNGAKPIVLRFMLVELGFSIRCILAI